MGRQELASPVCARSLENVSRGAARGKGLAANAQEVAKTLAFSAGWACLEEGHHVIVRDESIGGDVDVRNCPWWQYSADLNGALPRLQLILTGDGPDDHAS